MKEEKKRKKKEQISIALKNSAKKLKANLQVGETASYNKTNRSKYFDNADAKENFKNKSFAGKKTMKDPITGKTLHRSTAAAKRKFARSKNSAQWAQHVPETDHIIPLKEVHEMVHKNPFINNDDIKRIANQDYNYEITSKSFNASKGKASNKDIVTGAKKTKVAPTEAGKVALIKGERRAKRHIRANVAVTTAANVGGEFWDGAIESLEGSVVPLAIIAYDHLVAIHDGKETKREAATGLLLSATWIAVIGGVNQVAKTALAQSSASTLKNLIDKNGIVELAGVAMVLKDSVIAYQNGEIDAEHLSKQVVAKVIVLAGGGAVSQTAGGAVGATVGSAICPGLGTVAGYAAGAASAMWFQACTENLLDEVYGDGAYGAIKEASESVQDTMHTTAEAIEKSAASVEAFEEAKADISKLMDDIGHGFDDFERLKGE